jgi:hypothetical protein
MRFIDQDIEDHFARNGYCKVQILNGELVEELRHFADKHILSEIIANSDYGMYVSLEEQEEKKALITAFVREKVAPQLDAHLTDFKIHLGGYLIKAPDQVKYTFPHQDWTFVDHETDHTSATVWISLYDIDQSNGTLGFLKGSHRFLNHIIGSPSPAVPTPSMNKELLIFSHLTFENVSAGEALIFNNKTIHAAMPNKSDLHRVAVGIGITPKSAGLYHYYLNPDNPKEFLKLEVEESFFLRYNNDDLMELYRAGLLPELCKVVGSSPVSQHLYPDQSTVEQDILQYGNLPNGHIMDLQNHFGQNEPAEEPSQEPETEEQYVDTRTFFQMYTPLNIYREARYRLTNLWK